MQHDAIAVIDFGGQYAHLIATKVRRHGVLAEIRQPEDPIEDFLPYRGIIVSGSPSLASHGEDSDYTRGIYDLDVPILGLCFGHQEIAKHYGGEVVHGGRQWGRADLHLEGEHALFKGLGPVEQVWMSHYDSVTAVGPEFRELGWSVTTDGGPDHRFSAIGSDTLRRYGFQFHPEVDDTIHGDEMIANFVLEICGCAPTWSMEAFLEDEMEKIRRQVEDGSVFLLASGGVDSTVAATLLARALGPERLELLHVDNGLMRKNESAAVIEFFSGLGLGSHLHFVDASERFLAALEGIVEPEAKRRAIGDTFVAVFEDEARRLGVEDHLLGQGTIYPDTIETGGTKRADTIKTHHNRVPVIEEMLAAGRVVEPLAELYKVEVRELGEKLEIPHELVWRHPFPGPGLGVRLLCGDGFGSVEGLEEIAPLVAEEGRRFGLDAEVLPIRSVGVKADLRAYEHPVLLTGDVDWETLIRAASVLTAEVPGINRCIWNLSPVPPATAVPLAATTTRNRLDVLRAADDIVMEGLRRHGLYDEIWQCPTVLVPLDLEGNGGELVVVRPIRSKRAMTATPVELPTMLLDELRRDILALEGISGLALDITSKPPGTIEWE
ncbi:MAG: glutamine-hydrolyzing GMP synthase [marine benthic group bacterium]|jgi:GMP synthase (glutamine-hydrolysing)|nr:glutamine-hydrolyzing GMP synthase [Gemmatimonadota bacterium]MCL7990953.1 glutamine-hydrolyzing GMP synthase [Gemmatimonadota bacterium]